MRAPTSLFALVATVPFFLVAAAAGEPATGSVFISTAPNQKDHVDFTAGGFEGKAQFLKFKLTGENEFTLISASMVGKGYKTLKNVVPDQGNFWVGLGNGRDGNCHLEVKPGADTTKTAYFQMNVYEDKYLSNCDWQDWVKVVCQTKNFTPNCEGWPVSQIPGAGSSPQHMGPY